VIQPADLATLTDDQADQKANNLVKPFAPNWAWAFANQGRIYTFLRQGPPGKLDVLLVSSLFFRIVCWLAVLVVGLLMLPMSGYQRSITLLLLAFAGLVACLFVGLLCHQAAYAGSNAAVVVVLIWLAQWIFKRAGRSRRGRPAVPPAPNIPAVAQAEQPAGPDDQAKP
jgi:lipopolysaccharide export LptBFGC system permease protein LptF